MAQNMKDNYEPVIATNLSMNGCPYYLPEENNPYPLCVNVDCKFSKTCNISAHMDEEPYWRDT